MGRLYNITVGGKTWSSQQKGVDDPGALNIEFDFFEYVYAIPMGNSTLTIEGVSLEDLQQAPQFAGQQLSMKAGMSAGLPLANPTQAGLVLAGQIFQSFGNWAGTEMTLDFVVIPSLYTVSSPGNIVLNWKKGTTLQQALATTLSIAYPNTTAVFRIAQHINSHDDIGAYSTLSNLAKHVKSVTKSPTSPGVDIVYLNTANTIIVLDGSVQTNPTQLQFTDLIGQPTWTDVNVMQFTTVMRADIGVGTVIKMPQGLQDVPGIVTTTAAAFPSQLKYKTAFQGTFLVQSVRQIGNFRDPNGASWATIFQCVPQTPAS
jgi:hypothetical protein